MCHSQVECKKLQVEFHFVCLSKVVCVILIVKTGLLAAIGKKRKWPLSGRQVALTSTRDAGVLSPRTPIDLFASGFHRQHELPLNTVPFGVFN